MSHFYEDLKKNQTIVYLCEHINEFNNLDNFTIQKLFQDVNFSPEFKSIICKICVSKINKLPIDIWVQVVSFCANDRFLIDYKSKIDQLNYRDFVMLIYNYTNIEDLIVLSDTDVFQKHFRQEKQNKLGLELQIFVLSKNLFLASNLSNIETIGKEINILLEGTESLSDNMIELINSYLREVTKQIEQIDFHNNIFKLGISMLNTHIKRHKVLTTQMIRFYTLYHIKELNLDSHCKEIRFLNDDQSFGYYQKSEECLTLHLNHVEKKLKTIFKNGQSLNPEAFNDSVNIITLKFISHEIGHIRSHKFWDMTQNSMQLETFKKTIPVNPFLDSFYRNGILHIHMQECGYLQEHNQFIEENRADLFSLLDTSKQLATHFSSAFPKEVIENFSMQCASAIIDLYTTKTERGYCVSSPMEKFNHFFQKNYSNFDDYKILNFERPSNQSIEEIFQNLFLGNFIPIEVLKELQKIATGQCITTDFYTELQKIGERILIINVEQKQANM